MVAATRSVSQRGGSFAKMASSPNATGYNLLGKSGKAATIKGAALMRPVDAAVLGSHVTEAFLSAEKLNNILKVIAQNCAQFRSHERAINYSETTCDAEANFHFTCDSSGKTVFAVIVAKHYPLRVAFALLEEFKSQSVEKGHVARAEAGAKEGSLKSAVRDVIVPLAKKYDDPATQDKLTKVLRSVDAVKDQMQINITEALSNLNSAEVILEKTEDLRRQAQVFQKQAVTLQRKTWWQQFRYHLMFGVGLLIIVLIITLVLLAEFGKLKRTVRGD